MESMTRLYWINQHTRHLLKYILILKLCSNEFLYFGYLWRNGFPQVGILAVNPNANYQTPLTVTQCFFCQGHNPHYNSFSNCFAFEEIKALYLIYSYA